MKENLLPTVRFKKLNPNAIIPTRATDGSAGFDLAWMPTSTKGLVDGKFMALDADHGTYDAFFVCDTGIAVAIPNGMVGLVFSRSGHGFHANVRLANCVGVIDSDYRGEIKVKLTIDSGFHRIQVGERVAQLVVVPCALEAIEVEEFDNTERGDKGFGSTDSKGK